MMNKEKWAFLYEEKGLEWLESFYAENNDDLDYDDHVAITQLLEAHQKSQDELDYEAWLEPRDE